MDDSSPTRIDVEDTVDWLVDGVRSVKVSEDILRELCARLTKAGPVAMPSDPLSFFLLLLL